jgi:hypothetical protein
MSGGTIILLCEWDDAQLNAPKPGRMVPARYRDHRCADCRWHAGAE